MFGIPSQKTGQKSIVLQSFFILNRYTWRIIGTSVISLTGCAGFAIIQVNIETEIFADTEKAIAWQVSAIFVSPRKVAMPANYRTVREKPKYKN